MTSSLKPPFQIEAVQPNDKGVYVTWKDGHQSFYHNLWLRDACRCHECWQHDTLSVNYATDSVVGLSSISSGSLP